MQLGKWGINQVFQVATEERKSYIFLMNKKYLFIVSFASAFIWGSIAFGQPQIVYTNALPIGLKSVNKGGEVECIFENKSKEYINVSWINDRGDFLSGNEYLAPGNKGHQGKTSTGCVHVLRTLDSKILGYFTFEKPGKVEVVIKPPK